MAACSQNITLVPGIELSPQEANRYKNIFAVQVPMCEVFRAVLKWECSDKQLGQTCADYFGQKKQQYEDRHAALVAEKNNKFKLPKIGLPTRTIEMLQEEPSKYDVTLMFSFLCEIFKSKVSYTHIGHVRSLSQLECLLKEAKNIRNAVMHEVADGAVNPMKFDEIVKAMHDVIDEASNVYSIPADEVTSFKSQIDGMWDEVRTDSEKAKAYCRFFLQTYGNKEAKVMWEAMLSEETLLFGDDNVECSKVFHSLELTLQKPKDQLECKISYTELLTGNDKFIVVIGDSGSGKSTLAKNLVIQHHIDGYDECHKDSYKVVQQMVNKMRNHECRVIITTRPSAADRLKDFLKREGVKFQEYEIAEICDLDDQLIFLEKYEKHVTPHAEKVVKSFSSLGPNIQELFSIQELFASKPVSMELRMNNALPPIWPSQKCENFEPLEVLTYVFMELSAAEESTVFWNNWPLLRDAVGGVAMHRWKQILLNCRDSQHIAEAIAGVYLAHSNNWCTDRGRGR
ncbi:uncharacterized protein LOC108673340 [Hyalella azteca]|uniref:Uncharacterized protein LOC108673340 n=1 Tax=Hyalella azteca TaxID=294128 RepID=A0A8B7NUI6_HYAAZ|nr:uncharacterized protein LOC108673340 [Hyalella azteca]